ncbi:MAG: hypothetical protein AAF226_09880 [Verrucomicrobiota bacterium]
MSNVMPVLASLSVLTAWLADEENARILAGIGIIIAGIYYLMLIGERLVRYLRNLKS